MQDRELTEALQEIVFQIHETPLPANIRGTIYEILMGCFGNEGLASDDMAACIGIDEVFDEQWEEMFGPQNFEDELAQELGDSVEE
jgi:hypothetical protein